MADLVKASLAISITRQGERISSCRVAMGSVAPTPLLLPKVADVLLGRIFSTELLAEAGKLMRKPSRRLMMCVRAPGTAGGLRMSCCRMR